MAGYYIGIDIGGTNIRAVAYDYLNNKILSIAKKSLVRCKDIDSEVEKNLKAIIDYICMECGPSDLLGIGVAMAALFDRNDGMITKWPNNSLWNGFHIREYLEKQYNVDIVLEDDANAAAIGELYFGEGKNVENLLYVCVSTGIGSGIIVKNQLFVGAQGFAGELGHIKVTDEPIKCTCNAYGCLQVVASGPAILAEYNRIRKDKADHVDYIDLAEVAGFASEGQAEAIAVFERAGRYLGRTIANALILFDLPLAVLGGGVMSAGKIIYEPIRRGLEDSIQEKRNVEAVVSKLGDLNGIMGALALVIRNRRELKKDSINFENINMTIIQ